jgi:hypothetical protein
MPLHAALQFPPVLDLTTYGGDIIKAFGLEEYKAALEQQPESEGQGPAMDVGRAGAREVLHQIFFYTAPQVGPVAHKVVAAGAGHVHIAVHAGHPIWVYY